MTDPKQHTGSLLLNASWQSTEFSFKVIKMFWIHIKVMVVQHCECIVLSPSVVSDSLQPYVARQAPLAIGFSKQKYWNG